MSAGTSKWAIFLVLAFAAPRAHGLPDNPYVLETTTLPTFEDSDEVDDRLLPTVGNGHLATNAFSDALHLNGVFNGRLGESHRARIRSRLAFDLIVEGCLDAERTYRLDMEQGLVEEEITCGDAFVTFRTFAHASLDRLMVAEVHVERTGEEDSSEVVVTRIDLSGEEDGGDFLWEDSVEESGAWYRQGETLVPETDESGPTEVHLYFETDPMPEEFVLVAGEGELHQVFVLAADTDADRAKQDYDEAMLLLADDPTGDSLRSLHTDNWARTWAMGKIELEGDGVETATRETIAASMYYIYSSLPSLTSAEADDPYGSNFAGIAPGGLARGQLGMDYNGHIFWDQETWMMPPIAMFRPDLARIMLNYRVKRIGEAQDRAGEGGYDGARFPWESAVSGAEVTPDLCPLCRENEQHITGDISWAIRFYIGQTHDLDWLTDAQPGFSATGGDLALETAKFWESRPTFDEDREMWEINDVMPPDENQEHANNSVFTNMVANLAVNTARWTTCLISGEATSEAQVPDDWLDKMKNLVFLYNAEKEYHEEFEGFDEQFTTGTLDERGIKIADAVLLGYPLMWTMPDQVRVNDLELYASIQQPDGPAMTWSMYTINWLDVGDEEKAEEVFYRSYELYVRPPFNVWTEKETSVGAVNFITGGGGFLQTVVFGYAGIRVYPYHMEFRGSYLPPGADAISFTGMHYLGSSFDLYLTSGEARFTCYEEGQFELEVAYFDGGQSIPLVCSGEPQSYPRVGFSLQSTSTLSDCPLPPDEFNVDCSGVEDDDDDDAADDDDDDDGGSAAVFGALASTLLPALLATLI